MSNSDHTPTASSCKNSVKRCTPSLHPSASKKPKLGEKLTIIEIENFLECHVCLDFPSSPIYNCDNAHFLCGQCAPKLTACPSCQNKNISPSPVSEKLAKQANKELTCANSEAGCKEGVLSTKFSDHLALCYYREVTCTKTNCDEKVKFREYTKHLTADHNLKIHIGPKFTRSFRLNEKKKDVTTSTMRCTWDPSVIKLENHEFIVHAIFYRHSKLFFSWVSVLGDKDLGKKYFWEVNFTDKLSSNMYGCSWRLPSLAFHEISSKESEDKLSKLSEVMTIPINMLKNLGKMDENNDNIDFDLTYEIKAV